jgi:biotin operon repressor|tara:strand:- start:905 stop:1594 length:690 start_codon:yes stop_codon:yes gene_type:complete
MEREFKGVWIPAEVWLDTKLTLVEKALLAEIDSFTGAGKSFHKSNETIQVEYGISRPTISKAIKKLQGLGYITSTSDGRVRHLVVQADRKILTGRGKDSFGQTEKTFRAEGKNSTPTNTLERTSKKTIKGSKARPQNLDEVLEAFKAVGAEEVDAMQFYDYYSANGWTQGRGKPIKDWKAAARGWIRRTQQFKANERPRKGTTTTGPSDGSLIEQHLRRLADGSGTGMA